MVQIDNRSIPGYICCTDNQYCYIDCQTNNTFNGYWNISVAVVCILDSIFQNFHWGEGREEVRNINYRHFWSQSQRNAHSQKTKDFSPQAIHFTLQMQNWGFLEIGRLKIFQLRCLKKQIKSPDISSENNFKTHPGRRLGRESPLAPRFLDFDLTTTDGKVFASFSWHQKLIFQIIHLQITICGPNFKFRSRQLLLSV